MDKHLSQVSGSIRELFTGSTSSVLLVFIVPKEMQVPLSIHSLDGLVHHSPWSTSCQYCHQGYNVAVWGQARGRTCVGEQVLTESGLNGELGTPDSPC